MFSLPYMGSAIIIIIILFFLVGHAVLIESYRGWFLKVKPFKPDDTITPSIFFTVIIPARNEEEQIGKCLQSVLGQNYPSNLFEVIVADDYSTHHTGPIVTAMGSEHRNLHLLQIENCSEKKN